MDISDVRVALPDGAMMMVQAHGGYQGSTDVAGLQALPFEEVGRSIEGFSTAVLKAIRAAAPSEATIEFGLDLHAESGKLTSLLVEGSAAAALKITLTWRPGSSS
jgi:hypothetical protein